MTHHFEFVVKVSDGRTIHMLYKGKSSRHKKVVEKIQQDLRATMQIHPDMINELYIKPVK